VTYYSAEHPDTAQDYHRLKQITRGGRQATEDKAIAAYMRVFDEKGREAAEEVYFSFFNKCNNG
jgi:nitrate reductase assembly molybdenum cofactor insertion protein NarJ